MKNIFLIVPLFLSLFFISCASNTDPKYFTVSFPKYISLSKNDEVVKIQLYLAEKYHPGNCFGMPGPEPPYMQREVTKESLEQIKNIRPKLSDLECEQLIKQMQRINVQKRELGEYYYEFSDGGCCNIIHYKGVIELSNDEIFEEIIEQTYENVPC